MKLWPVVLAVLFFLSPALAQNVPPKPKLKIALWDAEGGISALSGQGAQLDSQRITRVANWLESGGATTELLRTDQISDNVAFGAGKFDVLILPGDEIPLWLIGPAKNFAQNGGILISLQTRTMPWSLPLLPAVNSTWQTSPDTKRSTALSELFGLKITQQVVQKSKAQRIAPDLLPYFAPDETDIENQDEFPEANPPISHEILQTPLVSFADDSNVIPLIQSATPDENEQVTPQVVAIERQKARALLVWDALWSDQPRPSGFVRQSELWAGITRFLAEWKSRR